MDNTVKRLQDFGRFLELEELLPKLRETLAEGKYQLREACLKTAQEKWEYERLEKGGFFQRIRGNLEERKEKAYQAYRQAQTQEQAARQEVEIREKALEDARQEQDALPDSLGWYLADRTRYLESGGDAASLLDAEAPILMDIAIMEAEKCLGALREAYPWARADAVRTRVSPENRKLEFLAAAKDHAGNLRTLLELLPEGTVEIPSYLKNPDGYILGFTSEYKQLDRLNLAIQEIRQIRSRLQEKL